MDLKDAVGEYATLLIDVADFARYNLDCDTARDDAVFDELHGGEVKRPTQAEKDRARANEPPMPRGDMNIELALLCAVGGNHDPFEENWRRLSDALDMSDCPDRVRDGIERRHGEFVAACASGDWRKVETCAERLTSYLLDAANTADAERKSDEELREDMKYVRGEIKYMSGEMKRKSEKARKTGRANQRKGEMNGNGREEDQRLWNQILTEVNAVMRNNPKLTQNAACKIVAKKHLKADGKTPIKSWGTIKNKRMKSKKKDKSGRQ